MEPTEEVQETTAMSLGSLLDAGENAVVTLVAGETHLAAHRAVLSARSPVFSAKFRHDTQEASGGQLVVADVEGPVLRQLLTYLYTLQAPQLPGMAAQLLAASDLYGVSLLKAECERQVAAQLSVETAAALAVLAVRHSCDSLRQAAINFIKARTHDVMATQGWADAVNNQPEDVVEVSRLLSEPTTETSGSHVAASSTTESTQQVKDTMATDLAALLDAGDNAVVTLVAGDTRLVAHRAVLANRSPVFAAKFRQDTEEASCSQLTVPDVEGAVLRQLLVYFYLLQPPQLPGMAPQLLAAADIYGMSVLKAECERQVAAQLSVETAAAVAILAVRHSCDNLRQAAISFIKAHTHEVMATQGWADAVRTQPEDVVEVSQLLSEPATQTSEPATAGSGITPATQPHSGTPASAAPPTAAKATPTSDDAMCEPAAEDGATNPATQPRSDQTSVPAVPPRAAKPTPSLDDAVPHMLNLAGEKGKRLIEVAKEGALDEVQALLAAGADVAAKDWTKWTALHHAASLGHVEAVGFLLAAGAEANEMDIYQETPLHCTAKNGHAAVVRLLVASAADPNIRDVHGRTPLHLAAYYGHTEAVQALIEAGADKTLLDEDGRTPLDIATQYHKQQVIDLLQ